MPSVLFWTAARLIHKPSETHPGQHKGKPNIMNNEEIQQEEWLQAQREDFDLFLARHEWTNAQAVIDSLRESGYEHSADILRKAYLKAQYESTKDWDNEGKLGEEQRESSHDDFVERQGGSYLD
jgi:hypothetical protein